jgi:hypothetical protein
MTTEQRLSALVIKLKEATLAESITWEATADEDAFRLSIPTANVRITMRDGFDQERGESYVSRSVQVLNDKGRVIEDYSPKPPFPDGFDELFKLARRSAYNTDRVLDQLLIAIGGK